MVDQEALKAAVDEGTALLEAQMTSRASKQDMAELEERLGQIASSGNSAETMDALKEALILMDTKVAVKADIDEIAALKAAVKKLANLRTNTTGALEDNP